MQDRVLRTRLAPSPTGVLHLGNARTFLVNWLLARQDGARIVLRIEDVDRARCREDLARACQEDLAWLGLSWDEGPFRQSDRLDRYESAFEALRARGLVYPCICSRREIQAAASAPHAEDEGPTYPGTCRDRFEDGEAAARVAGRAPAWRFRLAPGVVEFDDRVRGPTRIDPNDVGGDFVVRTVEGVFAYQLAVVVDDGEQRITDVVRADDLVPSTPRQILLHRALGFVPPRYAHLPLVLAADGRRMSKRHGDLHLANLRAAGVPAERVVARLARMCGIPDVGPEESAAGLVGRFDLARLSRDPVRVADATG